MCKTVSMLSFLCNVIDMSVHEVYMYVTLSLCLFTAHYLMTTNYFWNSFRLIRGRELHVAMVCIAFSFILKVGDYTLAIIMVLRIVLFTGIVMLLYHKQLLLVNAPAMNMQGRKPF